MNFKIGSTLISSSLAAALVLSASISGVAVHRLRGLESELLILKSQILPAVGTSLPPVIAETVDGAPTQVSFAGYRTPTVIYVFSPQCMWCARNLNNLRAVASVCCSSFRLIGLSVSTEGLSKYVRANGIAFPVFRSPSVDTVRAYGLSGTPTTLVVGTDGKLDERWIGAWMGTEADEVARYFHVSLPGLLPTPKGLQ